MFGWFLIELECRLRTVVMQGGVGLPVRPLLFTARRSHRQNAPLIRLAAENFLSEIASLTVKVRPEISAV